MKGVQKEGRRWNVKRGQIYYVDLDGGRGSEVQKTRPCLVIQNDIGNKYSPTTIIVPISHRKDNIGQPTQVVLEKNMQESGMEFIDGVIMTEQIRTVDKSRIKSLAGALLPEAMHLVDKALAVSIGLTQV